MTHVDVDIYTSTGQSLGGAVGVGERADVCGRKEWGEEATCL